ncbi:O-succinylhomoserine sulfhydrylase [Terrirubrum flagellatum]|uniref:O-succinylhomoserine sulfhydrylase n=1 Tax=Terrirubrum flagellatum TaxID=2895980 RepID=UPI003CC80FAA
MSQPAAPANSLRLATQMVHGGTERSQWGETSEALILTSGFVYERAENAEARFKNEEPGFQYSRFGNPTVSMFEERMALLEGAEAARATATGMAAVFAALMCQLRAGDHVVAARAMFGSCRFIVEDLLPRYGIASTLVDGKDLAAWKAAVRPNTKILFFETPSNPTLELVDIAAVVKIAREAGARTVVDNVFATPFGHRPMELGVDVVVYSATKHIDGQGRCLGGVVLGSQKLIIDELLPFIRNTGPSISPFNAWVLLKGLETFPLRIERHAANAAKVADALAEMKGVKRVIYPGRADFAQAELARRQLANKGSLVAFDIDSDKAGAFRFMNAMRIVKISNNLGDAKSLMTHPATTTHQRLTPEARAELGIGAGTVRLSVGLEDADDLIEDLAAALKAI